VKGAHVVSPGRAQECYPGLAEEAELALARVEAAPGAGLVEAREQLKLLEERQRSATSRAGMLKKALALDLGPNATLAHLLDNARFELKLGEFTYRVKPFDRVG
jgi:hypothetical protein